LELPHSSLKVVASTMVMELKSLQRHVPALSIASAVNERLTDLIVGGRIVENDQIQRFHMYSEAARRKTFDSWPHMDYKWALPDQMAQAGFYHQSSESGDDRAMCFTCSVCLVCWEKTDEPWGEHERHSPDCPFLKGEYTQNVPLSVTYATSPAESILSFDIMSSGDSGSIICMGNSQSGEINVWNVDRQLEKYASFNIGGSEKNIFKQHNVESDLNIKLSALCTFKKQTIAKVKESPFEKSKNGISGTRIVAAAKCSWSNDEKQQETCKKGFLFLYAVTEAPKSSSSKSNNASAANGNVTDEVMGTYSNSNKNGSSLITILESSHEERIDGFDDFLKYIDENSSSKVANSEPPMLASVAKNPWSFISHEKNDSSEMDSAKSLIMNGPASTAVLHNSKGMAASKTKPQNELACFIIKTYEIALENNYEISEIHPSCDNRFLLVVLKQTETDEEVVFMETDDTASSQYSTTPKIKLLVYEIDDKGLLNETIISDRIFEGDHVPIEFCMLPKFDTNGRLFSGSPIESNAFVITCIDGSIKVLSITTLQILSEARVESEKFISSVYCKNLERLCACTKNGSLHFYSFYDLDSDSSDEIEDETTNTMESSDSKPINYDNILPSTSAAQPKIQVDEKQQKTELIAHRKDLTLSDLKLLYSLTLFDEMLTPYSAEVPGCWTELGKFYFIFF
jgi:baculoviral IAP repeat-containing protein 6 (apollon)